MRSGRNEGANLKVFKANDIFVFLLKNTGEMSGFFIDFGRFPCEQPCGVVQVATRTRRQNEVLGLWGEGGGVRDINSSDPMLDGCM